MNDLGDPTSYLLLRAGTSVYSSDGERIGEGFFSSGEKYVRY